MPHGATSPGGRVRPTVAVLRASSPTGDRSLYSHLPRKNRNLLREILQKTADCPPRKVASNCCPRSLFHGPRHGLTQTGEAEEQLLPVGSQVLKHIPSVMSAAIRCRAAAACFGKELPPPSLRSDILALLGTVFLWMMLGKGVKLSRMSRTNSAHHEDISVGRSPSRHVL